MYSPTDKQRSYRRIAKALRALASDLGISSYDIRHCYGGIAVPGEAIFHSDTLYISVPLFPSQVHQVHQGYFRSCDGRKDYTGGRNFSFEEYPIPVPDTIRRALPQIEGLLVT